MKLEIWPKFRFLLHLHQGECELERSVTMDHVKISENTIRNRKIAKLTHNFWTCPNTKTNTKAQKINQLTPMKWGVVNSNNYWNFVPHFRTARRYCSASKKFKLSSKSIQNVRNSWRRSTTKDVPSFIPKRIRLWGRSCSIKQKKAGEFSEKNYVLSTARNEKK